jgi:hypothetical protein
MFSKFDIVKLRVNDVLKFLLYVRRSHYSVYVYGGNNIYLLLLFLFTAIQKVIKNSTLMSEHKPQSRSNQSYNFFLIVLYTGFIK